jgi:MFS family permease
MNAPVALRAPDFRRLWTAGLISDTGDWLLLVSLPILVFQLTGSTLGTAAAFLIELAPPVVLAPLVGHIADRFDRRRILLAVSLAQAVGLIPLLAVHGRADLPIVYGVIAVESALAALFDPTKNAFLPTLVDPDELISANGLIGMNQNLGRLIGGPIGGLLLAEGDLSMIVAVDALSFVVAAVLIARLRARPAATAPADDPRPIEAARFADALRNPAIRGGLAVTAVTSVAQGIFVVLFIVFVARTLHGDAAETGLLRGIQAIGAIGAGLLLATIGKHASAGRMTAVAATAFGLLALATWNAPELTRAEPLYVALFILVGAPGLILMTGLLSAMQAAAPPELRGRVFAAFGVASAIGQAAGMLGAGLFGDRLGVLTVLNTQGCLYLLGGLVAALTMRTPMPPAPALHEIAVPAGVSRPTPE